MKKIRVYRVMLLLTSFLAYGTSSAQGIPNSDFETLSINGSDTLPEDWTGSGPFGRGSSTISYSGNYSLAVWNWYSYAHGIAFNGDNSAGMASFLGGTPFTQKATKLTGYLYYDEGEVQSTNDSAIIAVLLKKYNTATSSIDTVGFGEIRVVPNTGFAAFEVDITDLQPGIDPDSVVIHLESSLSGFCSSGDGNCLYLYVDDLALETTMGIVPVINSDVQYYPNPATEFVNIQWIDDADRITIYSADGREVKTIPVRSLNSSIINTSSFDAGIYFFTLEKDGTIIERKKIIIQK